MQSKAILVYFCFEDIQVENVKAKRREKGKVRREKEGENCSHHDISGCGFSRKSSKVCEITADRRFMRGKNSNAFSCGLIYLQA